MMRNFITTLAAILATTVLFAQQLPQFTSSNFDGWTYNNPGIQLNSSNIAGGRIVLYVNSQGDVLTLTSPLFECHGIDSIEANVVWYTSSFRDNDFELSRTALTMAIDDVTGNVLDSATTVPTVLGSTHSLTIKLAVPARTDTARLRFVSWQANHISSGAIKRALITGIAATTPPDDDPIPGDVDGNGVVNISDVTMLIQAVLMSSDITNGDIDGNGVVNITDVTMLIDQVLRH